MKNLNPFFNRYYPVFDLSSLSIDDVLFHLKRDKKRLGPDLTMILTQGVGQHIKADDVKEEEIKSVFKEFSHLCKNKFGNFI